MADRLTSNVKAVTDHGPLFGVYKYNVVFATSQGFNVVPLGNGPPLQNVQGGAIGQLTLLTLIGQAVLIVFEEGDPSKPIVLSVLIPPAAIVDANLTSGSGPVTALNPIVAPLVAP